MVFCLCVLVSNFVVFILFICVYVDFLAFLELNGHRDEEDRGGVERRIKHDQNLLHDNKYFFSKSNVSSHSSCKDE